MAPIFRSSINCSWPRFTYFEPILLVFHFFTQVLIFFRFLLLLIFSYSLLSSPPTHLDHEFIMYTSIHVSLMFHFPSFASFFQTAIFHDSFGQFYAFFRSHSFAFLRFIFTNLCHIFQTSLFPCADVSLHLFFSVALSSVSVHLFHISYGWNLSLVNMCVSTGHHYSPLDRWTES